MRFDSLVEPATHNIDLAIAAVLAVEVEVWPVVMLAMGSPTVGGRIIAVGLGVLPSTGRTAAEDVGKSAIGRDRCAMTLNG